MKLSRYVLFGALVMLTCANAAAQNNDDAFSFVKQAQLLNKDGKYADAVDKYRQALKLDSNYAYANYGIAYSLLALGKGDEGIPNLEKVIKANTGLTAWCYDLLGSIYDKDHQSAKAIEAYNNGIKADPKYQSLYYNLGLVYFRDKNYAEAERLAIESIKLDPKHANSQRMYALVTFHQNKRAAALLGFCSFILLEPHTARSTEAYGNMLHILLGGTLKAEPGVPAPVVDANNTALNWAINQSATEAAKKKYASQPELFTAQLTAIFTAVGQLAEKQSGDDFFRKYFAAYFYQLAQTPNMAAFARLMISGSNKDDYTKWTNEHSKEMSDLDNWIKTTDRNF